MSAVNQYGRQSISEADVEAVVEALRSGWLTTGPAVERFERRLSAVAEGAEAVVCSSGTAALTLAYAAAGLRPGERVVVPDLTFVATAAAALQLGAELELVDVDPTTGNLDLAALARRLERGPAPRLVVPVHFAGRPVDLPRLAALAVRYGFDVVEDACHGLGAYDGRHAIGAARDTRASVFSFHPVKSITSAEGGAVLTRDPALAAAARRLRHHGIEGKPERFRDAAQGFDGEGPGAAPNPWYAEVQAIGWNFRLSDLHAALGEAQLRRLERFITKREALARAYDQAFARQPLVTPLAPLPPGQRSAHHLYVVRIDFVRAGLSRAAVMRGLAARGVGSQVHYLPLHRQPALADRGIGQGQRFEGAERYYAEALTLPLHVEVTERDVAHVADTLNRILTGGLGGASPRGQGERRE